MPEIEEIVQAELRALLGQKDIEIVRLRAELTQARMHLQRHEREGAARKAALNGAGEAESEAPCASH